MTSPYIVKDNQAYKASPNRSFIYFLSLNTDETDAFKKPFFIGHSKNIAKTFSRHKMSDWHYKNFNRPIIINIVGSVPDSLIEQAEDELKKILVKSGCIILKTWTVKKAEDYTKNKHPIFYDLTPWYSRNNVKKKEPNILDNSYNNLLVDISVEKIMKIINYNEQLSTETLNLALKIASHFSADKGYSEIVFTEIKNKNDAVRVKKQLNKIRFIWNMKEKFKPYTANKFYLTKPMVNSLLSIKTDKI